MYLLIILALSNPYGGSVRALDHIPLPDKESCIALTMQLEAINPHIECTCFEITYEQLD